MIETVGYDIVYRGQPINVDDISPKKSIWVTYDYDFANEYGNVKEYKLPKNLNILDTNCYNEWENLVDEFDEDGDYEEYKYEPTDEFVSFLNSKGYDGFMNGDNILIFDKSLLTLRKFIKTIIQEHLTESYNNDNIFYHGSTDKNLAGKKGIHVGTKLAATQALQARIGVPSEGEWDGTREYGKTLLAGKNTLKNKSQELGYYCATGFNCGHDIPEEDYYPIQRNERAKYSDGTPISFNSKPIVFPVKIIGRMTNSPYMPHTDEKANSMMLRNLKIGNAKSGYYYENIGEDEGSISAVVPNATFLKIL